MLDDRKLAEQTIGPRVRSEYERIHRLERAFLMSGEFTDLMRLRKAREEIYAIESQYVDETQAMWERHLAEKEAQKAIKSARDLIDRLDTDLPDEVAQAIESAYANVGLEKG